MATRSDVPELAVDELRRRGRRRLVGAIVLALAAAVLLPLLLESEPKPLGEDVLIQIPPVDNGKFINPLSSSKAPDPKVKGDTANGRSAAPAPPIAPSGQLPPAASPALKEKAADGETRVPAAPTATTPPVGATPAVSAPGTPTADTNAAAPDSKLAAALPAAKPATDATVEAKAAPAASASAAATKSDAAYVVQIAAFSDGYGARSLVLKLKRGGFPGYAEAVTTDKGTLHRVRVGPYPSREAADAVLAKLKAAGFNGMIAHVG